MIIIQIFFLMLLLLICPSIMGGNLIGKQKRITLGECYVRGYVLMFSAFQVIALIVFFMDLPLHTLTEIFMIFMILFILLALVCRREQFIYGFRNTFSLKRPSWPLMAALILILVQTLICGLFMHLDQDDAFYVGTAVTSVNTDSIFKYDCYTGTEYNVLPSRYILSPFPIFLAVLSQITGIHATIIAHTAFPFFFIPLSYYIYWLIGKQMFRGEKKQSAVFLLLVVVVQLFSYYSVYTPGAFLLFRIWQGKAVLANILLPGIFYAGILLFDKERLEKYDWMFMVCLATASCLVSTMGFMLAPIMIGFIGLLCAIRKKSAKILFGAFCSCIPNIIFSILYVIIR